MNRETEWPPDAQERALALAELDDRAEVSRAQLCACGCGQPAVDTQREPGEPGPPYSVGHKICTARQALDAYKRFVLDTLEPPKGQARPSTPEIKPSDGLVFTLAPVMEAPATEPEEGR